MHASFYVFQPPPPNLHLRYSDSLKIAARLRATAIQAVASIVQVDCTTLGNFDDPSATLLQLLSPGSHGGLLIPDPAILARPCALANLADCLPSLLAETPTQL